MKTLENSTEKEIDAKTKAPEGEYYTSPCSRELRWYSVREIEMIADQGIEYFQKEPRAIRIDEFTSLKGLSRKTWEGWVAKYDWLREKHDYMKMLIANKREKGMVFADLGMREKPNMLVMHLYDPDWDKVNRYHKGLAEEAENDKLKKIGIEYLDLGTVKDEHRDEDKAE